MVTPENVDKGEDMTWRENQQRLRVPLDHPWRTYQGIARTTQDRSSTTSHERPADGSDENSDINTYESPNILIPERFHHLSAQQSFKQGTQSQLTRILSAVEGK